VGAQVNVEVRYSRVEKGENLVKYVSDPQDAHDEAHRTVESSVEKRGICGGNPTNRRGSSSGMYGSTRFK
jgi:hypothetical protein